MTSRRLAEGGLIDRDKPIGFSWNGRQLSGCQGDTLASALIANDQWLLARSFKYHRPRGVMSAGVEESGALLTIGQNARLNANVKATTQELFEGLQARSQNAWPSVEFDLAAVSNLFSRFLAAGFYYKTFMGTPVLDWGRGTAAWMFYEKWIRRAAGMGRASPDPDPDSYEHAHAFCDLLVVGSGPAGIQVALSASQAGLQVWLVEQDSLAGGDYLNRPAASVQGSRLALLQQLEANGVKLMTRTTVFGLYDNNVAGLLERVSDHLPAAEFLPRQRLWTVRSRYIVVASGAIERSMAFGNNDLPGVMGAAAARCYLNRFALLCGQQVLVATNNDSAYAVSCQLAEAGAQVTVLDARRQSGSPSVAEQARAAGVKVRFKSAALKGRGRGRIKRLDTAVLAGREWRAQSQLETDCLLVSGGWSPVIHLLSHRGHKPQWDPHLQAFTIAREATDEGKASGMAVIGSAAGLWDHDACIESGEHAALAAAQALSGAVFSGVDPNTATDTTPAPAPDPVTRTPAAQQLRGDRPNDGIVPLYEMAVPGRRLKSFIDFEHDVTTDDVRLALQEGFVSVEHLKRYTTLGMATDQGKMGNVPGIAAMAEALECDIADIGTTTFRPPYTPVSLGALRGRRSGEHFRPLRRTALHDWNLDHGAVMTEAGLWQRPWYFPLPGEGREQAYIREAASVRQTAGLCDVTSLGKIQLQGPDAAEFLDRVYANSFASLPIGRARYGIMLRDDGIVLDDGTTWRLAECEYFMTTTTAHAARVLVWLEELLQCRWPQLRVQLSSVSEQWAGVSLAGPLSRQLLAACVEAQWQQRIGELPFMAVLDARLCGGLPCRVARISFSGELAYEIYTPSDLAVAMMDLLWPAVHDAGGCLYGLEALGTLRIEKGHVTAAELDGRVTIDDAGLGKMASDSKPFIGGVLRQRAALQQADRPRLVGIVPLDRNARFNAGSLLFASEMQAGHGQGWVSGVSYSPALGHWIGIGFASGGHLAWQGKTLSCADPLRNASVAVELVSPHMYDPAGERQRV